METTDFSFIALILQSIETFFWREFINYNVKVSVWISVKHVLEEVGYREAAKSTQILYIKPIAISYGWFGEITRL